MARWDTVFASFLSEGQGSRLGGGLVFLYLYTCFSVRAFRGFLYGEWSRSNEYFTPYRVHFVGSIGSVFCVGLLQVCRLVASSRCYVLLLTFWRGACLLFSVVRTVFGCVLGGAIRSLFVSDCKRRFFYGLGVQLSSSSCPIVVVKGRHFFRGPISATERRFRAVKFVFWLYRRRGFFRRFVRAICSFVGGVRVASLIFSVFTFFRGLGVSVREYRQYPSVVKGIHVDVHSRDFFLLVALLLFSLWFRGFVRSI